MQTSAAGSTIWKAIARLQKKAIYGHSHIYATASKASSRRQKLAHKWNGRSQTFMLISPAGLQGFLLRPVQVKEQETLQLVVMETFLFNPEKNHVEILQISDSFLEKPLGSCPHVWGTSFIRNSLIFNGSRGQLLEAPHLDQPVSISDERKRSSGVNWDVQQRWSPDNVPCSASALIYYPLLMHQPDCPCKAWNSRSEWYDQNYKTKNIHPKIYIQVFTFPFTTSGLNTQRLLSYWSY